MLPRSQRLVGLTFSTFHGTGAAPRLVCRGMPSPIYAQQDYVMVDLKFGKDSDMLGEAPSAIRVVPESAPWAPGRVGQGVAQLMLMRRYGVGVAMVPAGLVAAGVCLRETPSSISP